MVSILDCQSKGEGSTPSKIANFKCGGYRLMVRHEVVALVMVGSIPLLTPNLCGHGSMVEHRLAKSKVVGSSPIAHSICGCSLMVER